MELTPAEIKIIETFRKIDRVNPAGADDATTASALNLFQRLVEGYVDSAKSAYDLFLSEAKKEKVVDLAAARAPRYEWSKGKRPAAH